MSGVGFDSRQDDRVLVGSSTLREFGKFVCRSRIFQQAFLDRKLDVGGRERLAVMPVTPLRSLNFSVRPSLENSQLSRARHQRAVGP